MTSKQAASRETDAFDILDQATVTIGAAETLLSLLDDLHNDLTVPDDQRRQRDQMGVLVETITRTVEAVHEELRAALAALTAERRGRKAA